MRFKVTPIGTIHTPFRSSKDIPIQSAFSDAVGEVDVLTDYEEGLDSLSTFSHIILLYWFHKAKNPKLKVVPYLGNKERGLFATRAPSRPNPIGQSVVEVLNIAGNRIKFKGADMLNETPLIDIKPFIPKFDSRPHATSGWLAEHLASKQKSKLADKRFEE